MKYLKINNKASNHFLIIKGCQNKTFGIKTKIKYKNTLSKRDSWKVWITGVLIKNKKVKIKIKTNFQNKKYYKFKTFWIWTKIKVNKYLLFKVNRQML